MHSRSKVPIPGWGCSSFGLVLARHSLTPGLPDPRLDPVPCTDPLWWYVPPIPSFRSRRQEDLKLRVILSCIVMLRLSWAT